MIRALVVDDEEPGRANLRYALAEHGHWQLVGECASAASAWEFLARASLAGEPVDVVFLDVQMPKESGLELARRLCQAAEPPLVIFVTAYNAYAVAAFEVHALDYLLKPFDDERLAQALARAESLLAQRQAYGAALRAYVAESDGPQAYCQQLCIRSVGRIETVALCEVRWLSAAGNYVELHLAARSVLHRSTLSELERRLDPADFLRVHRSQILRRELLCGLSALGEGAYLAELHGGGRVPVSERHVAAVRAALETV